MVFFQRRKEAAPTRNTATMILSKHHLFSLVAVTLKGVKVGKVIDVGLDSISQSIVTYHVRPFWQWRKSLGMKAIAAEPLRIQKSSVIRMTETELIIEDAALVACEDVSGYRAAQQPAQQGVMGQERLPP